VKAQGHNLKTWVSSVLLFLAAAPLVVAAFLPRWLVDFHHPTADDVGLMARLAAGRFDFACYLAGSILVLPILLLIGWNPGVAYFCAQDKTHIAETISVTRRTALIVAVIAVICLGTLIYELLA
jgi:hypothetical protein